MKITKELEAEIRTMMDDYWGSYFRGDLEHWQSYLVDDYRNIGGTEEEIWNSKQEIVEYTHRVIDQMAGLTELRNMQRQIIPYDGYLMVHEFTDIFIRIEEKWTFYGKFRLSSLIQKIADTWKVLHQHGSYPDSHTEQGEAFAFDTLRKENTQLREAVKRRTVELENKNHELKIEAALERVRSASMAMQGSAELASVARTVFEQLKVLGIDVYRSWIDIFHVTEGYVLTWSTDFEGNFQPNPATFPLDFDETMSDFYRDYKSSSKFIELEAHGDGVREWFDYLYSVSSDPIFKMTSVPDDLYQIWAKHKYGTVATTKLSPITNDEKDILNRFANVFEQAYTRFLDLQKAEAQTREMQIEAALERARAQSMMMQHSDEINTISNVFHEQLNLLGIPSEFSYVWLPDEANETHQFWASWSEVKAGENSLQSKQVTYPLDKSEPYTAACFAAWATPDVVLEEFIPPADIAGFFDVWKELLSGAKKLKPEYFQEGIYYSEAYMRYGCFGINFRRKLSEEEKNILKRFSKEFEQAYTRFLDLQTAEKQALVIREERDRLEIALKELHATQDQLVQQEKLASLGQLTAGIAHEIKNPLNFVNNFSDVSLELVEEARGEVRRVTGDGRPEVSKSEKNNSPLKKGDKGGSSSPQKQEVSEDDYDPGFILEILDDIEANLRKIHEHGSRADGIVKSMLQHSRGGDGKPEPTDLNALVKEYINLSFHGMRAGNDPINVDIDLKLGESIGEVPLVAEDFSRVILNLCNNAFDAMRERLTGDGGPVTGEGSPLEGSGEAERSQGVSSSVKYAPKLSIRTKSAANAVTIEIEDNGPGIPEELKDKIMQPFFTTKKGTQGSGLGLSITNDIVKAHGGRIVINSLPGKGTTFTIHLDKQGQDGF
jgi:signal transduction histidine kinase